MTGALFGQGIDAKRTSFDDFPGEGGFFTHHSNGVVLIGNRRDTTTQRETRWKKFNQESISTRKSRVPGFGNEILKTGDKKFCHVSSL